MRFLVAITIDTERDWRFPSKQGFRMIKMSLPVFLEVGATYGIRFSFLVTGDVAKNLPDLIKECGKRHEIGCHTHPLFHEKYKDRTPGQFGSLLSHHSLEAQFKMIKADTSVIEGIVKGKLKSFRAGQLGGDWRTILALRRLGYLIDSSVRPEWNPFGWPPYPLNANLKNVGKQSIIEIPLSGFIGPKIRLSSRLKSLYQTLHKIWMPLEFFLVANSHAADFAYAGKKGIQPLTEFIEFFQQANADFCTLEIMSKHGKQKNLDMILRKSLAGACKFLRRS